MPKKKYYVVWDGVSPGIYNSWEECQLQTKGYENAKYKSFDNLDEARKAFNSSPFAYMGKQTSKPTAWYIPEAVICESLAVDAACSGNPGPMEYRGVYIRTKEEIFRFGPTQGTNNIGEFLAIVHGLALLKQKELKMPIYTDSKTALSWVKNKKCKTLLTRDNSTEELFKLIERAEKWLKTNTYATPILKWDTKEWGEIPADFGRK